jgi:hypothetical protein
MVASQQMNKSQDFEVTGRCDQDFVVGVGRCEVILMVFGVKGFAASD